MKKWATLKNHLQEIQLITHRSMTALVIMLILITFLILRLGFLQCAQHAHYTTLSKKNWLDIVPVEPTRGLIYDRNGLLLAENLPVFSLDIIPEKNPSIPQALAEIAKIIPLNDTEIAQFQKELKQHRRFEEIPLKLRLTEAEVARFYENQYRFPGALIKARLIRHYPLGAALSHIVGYVGRINLDELDNVDPSNYSATNYIGKLGIEKFYEDELHGTVGYEQAENDASGQPVRILHDIKPMPGKNLYLTLDSNLQIVAEQALAGHNGAVVILQPATGQILAMVSEPSFDPNLFVDGMSNQAFQQLEKAPSKPLYNRTLRGLYPLASTIKPYIALEGLDSETTTPNFTIFDPGWYQLPNSEHVYHDWKPHGHGTVNLNHALVSSCDTYFFALGHKMGIKHIDDILTRFGFGELTGIDVGEELPGIIASPAWKRRTKGIPWHEGDTINSAIGQGYMQATPLQLAQGIAILANRGKRFLPHLLLTEQEAGKIPEPQATTELEPVKLHQEDNWKMIITALQNVITSPLGTGYAHFGHDMPYTIAGKTGTAQVYSIKHRDEEGKNEEQDNLPEALRDHSLFVAFAPVDKPQIAIAVIAEHSKLAASIARHILDYYFTGSTPRLARANKENMTHDSAPHL
ncbi:MAG: mrdA [Gammaproteobacteria bacterium]|jgi:penicillin-binding protein 2|nr:mrdA [Gammaproteobacteria bacterium]